MRIKTNAIQIMMTSNEKRIINTNTNAQSCVIFAGHATRIDRLSNGQNFVKFRNYNSLLQQY